MVQAGRELLVDLQDPDFLYLQVDPVVQEILQLLKDLEILFHQPGLFHLMALLALMALWAR